MKGRLKRWLPLVSLMLTAVASGSCQDPADPGKPGLAPPPSAGHALVYHDSLGTVLLLNAGLGKAEDSLRVNEPTRIWAWQNRRWMVIDSGGPPIRNLAGVAYDSRRNRLVLHGGSSAKGLTYGETWEWGDHQWRQRSASGPGPRDHTAMAYDPVRGRTVLFGGQVRLDSFPQDTWEWDGNQWTVAATTGPPPRVHYGMQFDSATGRVLLFGGYRPGVGDLGDVWSWDGSQWSAGGQAVPRTHHILASHGRLGAVVAVGGMTGHGSAPIMSVWRNGTWIDAGGTGPAPRARYLAGAAYDPARRVLVLFGGGDPAGMDLFSDTWEHDGTAWSRQP